MVAAGVLGSVLHPPAPLQADQAVANCLSALSALAVFSCRRRPFAPPAVCAAAASLPPILQRTFAAALMTLWLQATVEHRTAGEARRQAVALTLAGKKWEVSHDFAKKASWCSWGGC